METSIANPLYDFFVPRVRIPLSPKFFNTSFVGDVSTCFFCVILEFYFNFGEKDTKRPKVTPLKRPKKPLNLLIAISYYLF